MCAPDALWKTRRQKSLRHDALLTGCELPSTPLVCAIRADVFPAFTRTHTHTHAIRTPVNTLSQAAGQQIRTTRSRLPETKGDGAGGGTTGQRMACLIAGGSRSYTHVSARAAPSSSPRLPSSSSSPAAAAAAPAFVSAVVVVAVAAPAAAADRLLLLRASSVPSLLSREVRLSFLLFKRLWLSSLSSHLHSLLPSDQHRLL